MNLCDHCVPACAPCRPAKCAAEKRVRKSIRAAIATDRERHAPTNDADTWKRLDMMGRWPADLITSELNADPRSQFQAWARTFADIGRSHVERAEMAAALVRGES